MTLLGQKICFCRHHRSKVSLKVKQNVALTRIKFYEQKISMLCYSLRVHKFGTVSPYVLSSFQAFFSDLKVEKLKHDLGCQSKCTEL